MISLKTDVKLHDLRGPIILLIMIAHGIYQKNGHNLVVTSLNDGKHSTTSLHYDGAAVDLRTTAAGILPDVIKKIHAELKKAVVKDFDVILEEDHIHVEYQPRRA